MDFEGASKGDYDAPWSDASVIDAIEKLESDFASVAPKEPLISNTSKILINIKSSMHGSLYEVQYPSPCHFHVLDKLSFLPSSCPLPP
jgi:hypothetical protein